MGWYDDEDESCCFTEISIGKYIDEYIALQEKLKDEDQTVRQLGEVQDTLRDLKDIRGDRDQRAITFCGMLDSLMCLATGDQIQEIAKILDIKSIKYRTEEMM